jgi:hypothetical protein
MSYAKVFAKVAVGLDKQPELIQHLVEDSQNEEGQRESLPEKAANVVRQAFIVCLNDRNTALYLEASKTANPTARRLVSTRWQTFVYGSSFRPINQRAPKRSSEIS